METHFLGRNLQVLCHFRQTFVPFCHWIRTRGRDEPPPICHTNEPVTVWLAYPIYKVFDIHHRWWPAGYFFFWSKCKSKKIPTDPWNIPWTLKHLFMKGILHFGTFGISGSNSGVCSRGLLEFSFHASDRPKEEINRFCSLAAELCAWVFFVQSKFNHQGKS